jgi:hypothetical protein
VAGLFTRRRVVGLGVGIGLAAAGPALAATVLSGNPRGVKLAHSVVRAMSQARVQVYSQTGFAAMHSFEGKVSSFSWEWGSGNTPAGSVRAREHAVVWLRHGRVRVWMDQLTPVCGPGLCNQVPAVLVLTHSGRYFAFGTPSSHTCFGQVTGRFPVAYGGVSWGVLGKVQAPVKAGATTKLSYVYPWAVHQVASETDVIANSSSRVRSGRVSVSAAGSAHAFVFSFHYSYPAHSPKQPHVVLCHG